MTKQPFDDYVYCETVEKWEREVLPQRLHGKALQWGMNLAWAVIPAGVVVAGTDWRRWLVVLAFGYVLLLLFTLLEELNENLRFVRRQVRTYRDAIKKANNELRQEEHPEKIMVTDAFEQLNRHWKQP